MQSRRTDATCLEFDIAALDRRPGTVKLVDYEGSADVFVTRVKCSWEPRGALKVDEADDEYFLAFSRICTHMGGHLIGRQHQGEPLSSIVEDRVIRCPCHLTCFDLCKGGLVVVGQATHSLPQLKLEAAGSGKLRLVGWLPQAGLPVGLPYGETSP